jgi:hypothetical protein
VASRRPASPYKFLDSYGVRDSRRFFGRDLETDLLLADVVVSRLVVLFAKTGTGKTSLINAGVRPRLHDRGYKTYFVRVREDPFAEARAALQAQAPKHFPVDGTLGEQLRGLAANVKRPVVVFFDQFEEFFLYTTNRDVATAQEFVAAIGELYDDAESGVHVVFSMREEWFVEMGFFRDRIPAIFHNDSNLRLRWFDRTQARDAIVKPAGEDAYERELVDTLIEELVESSRALSPTPPPGDIEPAQLQIVCDTLWREARNGVITLDDYRRLGEQGHGESVAQQILDRRLVQEFENLDKPQLDLLAALLPELETPARTKRVREYEDLVSSLQSTPAFTGDRDAIRALLERLRRERLLDILPRGDGEIVELTHDYLVTRLDELLTQIALIWPRRVLADGVKAFRKRKELLRSNVVRDVISAAGKLSLGSVEGGLLLRSALGHLVDVSPILPALVRSGAPVWTILEERIVTGAEAERARAVETLVLLGTPEADAVLAGALRHEEAAPHVLRLLSRAQTTGAVDLLVGALERPELAAQAEAALAELASAPGQPGVAGYARDKLRVRFSPGLADPASAPSTIQSIVRLDAPVAVELLEEALRRSDLVGHAREGLLTLTQSADVSVATRARAALVARVEQALTVGDPEPWCVETLEQLADPAGAELLGRMLDFAPLAPRARAGLLALQQSDRDDVVTAATRQLAERGAAPAPEPGPPPPPTPSPAPGPELSGQLEYHFDTVLRLLANGRLIPFLGPGASLVDRPPEKPWDFGTPFPPTDAELARYLATRNSYPEGELTDLPRVAEYAQLVFGRRWLNEQLREVFDQQYQPTRLHRFLARLPQHFRYRTGSTQIVATTSFDDSLERAFDEAGEAVDVVSYLAAGEGRGRFVHRSPGGRSSVIENPAEYTELRPGERTVILRFYGAVDRVDESRDSFVVTEDDYVDYASFAGGPVSFLPATLTAALGQSNLLFLGANLRDLNFRILLNSLWQHQSFTPDSWAVQQGASKVDIELWRRKNVELVDAPLAGYAAELERRLFEFDVAAVPA